MPRFFRPKPGRFPGMAALCDRVLLPADPPEKVSMADFEEAVRLETGGKWAGKGPAIGFGESGKTATEPRA